MEWFGLGIMLEVRDFASQSLQQVVNSFNNTRQTVDNFATGFQQAIGTAQLSVHELRDTMLAGFGMQQTGQQFLNFSKGLLSPLVQVTQQVTKTGSQFENWRKTLKALYKDEALASEKLAWGMELASTTPFEMTDVTSALIGFKAIGVEADQMVTTVSGAHQSMLQYIGDLAALRPDVGLQGIMMGVRNLMGGDGGKSLRMRMDMDFEAILGRDWGDTTEQLVKDLAEVSDKVASGLMGELEGTWGQVTSNLKDQATRFFLALADGGMFDGLKKSLGSFADVINNIDDAKMASIGKNLSEAFNMIWKPVDLVIKGVSKLVGWIANLASSSSFLGKLVSGFLALSGAITGVIGVLLTFGGGIITTISSFGLFMLTLKGSAVTFAMVKTYLLGLIATVGKFALVLGGALALWKADVDGIRTTATNMVNSVLYAFRESAKISRMGADDMINAVARLDMTNFGDRLTYRLLQLRVLWQAVCEAWDDYTLSEDTFRKVQALGLLPLLETILDFKMRFDAFWEGFKTGFKGVTDIIIKLCTTVGEGIMKVVDFLFPIKKTVDDTRTSIEGGINLAPWELFGTILGSIASFLATGIIATKVFDIAVKIGTLAKNIVMIPLNIIGSVAGMFSKLGTVVKTLLPVATKAIGALVSFAVANPVIAGVALAVMALVGVGIYVVKHWDEVKAKAIEVWGNIKDTMTNVANDILGIFGTDLESLKLPV